MEQRWDNGRIATLARKVRKIESFGKVYVERCLFEPMAKKSMLLHDRHEALLFFFSKSFMRGRRDEISERFLAAAIKTMSETVPGDEQKPLGERLKDNGVNNRHDRGMVIDAIDFTTRSLTEHDSNIVAYAVSMIKSGKVKEAFDALDRIHAVGDKIASFYLRDVAIVYGLSDSLCWDTHKYCFPVDTWLRQVSDRLGVTDGTETLEEVKKRMVLASLMAGASPLMFNCGAWLVGANSFELLLDSM